LAPVAQLQPATLAGAQVLIPLLPDWESQRLLVAAEADLEARLAAQMQVAETAAAVAAPDGQVQETAAALLRRDRETPVARPAHRPRISTAAAAAVQEVQVQTARPAPEPVVTVPRMTASPTQLAAVAELPAAWRRQAVVQTQTTTAAAPVQAIRGKPQRQTPVAAAVVLDPAAWQETKPAELGRQALW